MLLVWVYLVPKRSAPKHNLTFLPFLIKAQNLGGCVAPAVPIFQLA